MCDIQIVQLFELSFLLIVENAHLLCRQAADPRAGAHKTKSAPAQPVLSSTRLTSSFSYRGCRACCSNQPAPRPRQCWRSASKWHRCKPYCDQIEGGKHTAADVVAKARAVLFEPELLRVMFDVGYVPPFTLRRRFDLVQSLEVGEHIENMPQGLCMQGSSARLLLCNDRYLEIYGLTREQIMPGCSLRDFLERSQAAGTFCRQRGSIRNRVRGPDHTSKDRQHRIRDEGRTSASSG